MQFSTNVFSTFPKISSDTVQHGHLPNYSIKTPTRVLARVFSQNTPDVFAFRSLRVDLTKTENPSKKNYIIKLSNRPK